MHHKLSTSYVLNAISLMNVIIQGDKKMLTGTRDNIKTGRRSFLTRVETVVSIGVEEVSEAVA